MKKIHLQAYKLWKTGEQHKEIARMLGVSGATVRSWCMREKWNKVKAKEVDNQEIYEAIVNIKPRLVKPKEAKESVLRPLLNKHANTIFEECRARAMLINDTHSDPSCRIAANLYKLIEKEMQQAHPRIGFMYTCLKMTSMCAKIAKDVTPGYADDILELILKEHEELKKAKRNADGKKVALRWKQ